MYKIANKYSVSVNDIIEFNQLPTTVLEINQQLLIPTTGGTIVEERPYHTVVSGDNLYKIAQRYNVTVDDLITANNLTTTVLNIGDKIYLPVSDTINSEDEIYVDDSMIDIQPEGSDEEGTIEYVVKSGDSLYSIGKKFNVTADEIKTFNNLKSNLLSIGQVLSIPSTEEYITYYVKSGDSLYSIAKEYNTTVDIIKRLNNLNSNMLSINQVLILPN